VSSHRSTGCSLPGDPLRGDRWVRVAGGSGPGTGL